MPTCRSKFACFNPNEEDCHVDVFLQKHLGSDMKYRKLLDVVVEKLLLLSHGQATVERGFSVNREVETVNMHEETMVAQHLICDHIYSVGGVLNVALSKELHASASASRQRYALHLE